MFRLNPVPAERSSCGAVSPAVCNFRAQDTMEPSSTEITQVIPGQRVRYRLMDGTLCAGGYLVSARHYGYVVLSASPDGRERCWTISTEAVRTWELLEVDRSQAASAANAASDSLQAQTAPMSEDHSTTTIEEEYEVALGQQHEAFDTLVTALERRCRT